MRVVEDLNGALHGLMADDAALHIIGEDILDPYGGVFKVTKGLSSAFPDRVMTAPISEAGIVGFASGIGDAREAGHRRDQRSARSADRVAAAAPPEPGAA